MATGKKRKGKSKAWYDKHNNDPYVLKARKAGYRARAAFKLEEIDKKHRLIKPGQNIIDLGAAPGSWSQYVARKVRKKNQALGNKPLIMVDLLPFEPIEGAVLIQADFTQAETLRQIKSNMMASSENLVEESLFDLVLSDMAPNITGIAMQDQARYERLLESVLVFCQTALRPGGNLLTKFFEGESAQLIRKQMKAQFTQLKTIKPDASRTHSKELYLLALNHK